MDIFTPGTMFQIILKRDLTKKNTLLCPYERTHQLVYFNEQSGTLKRFVRP